MNETYQDLEGYDKPGIDGTPFEIKIDKSWSGSDVIYNNYFIPSIHDIRVGYECQIKRGDEPWEGLNLANTSYVKDAYVFWSLHKLRVSYLTKEQIENEGWKYRKDYSDGTLEFDGKTASKHRNLPVELNYNQNNCRLYISVMMIGVDECIFDGECKDINTFRYICKLLGI